MKKVITSIAMIFIGIGVSIANPTGPDNSGKSKEDSSTVAAAETTFKTQYSNDSRQLLVNVSGTSDPYATVSVTNQRGTTILCSFVQEKSGEMTFDLSKLEEGIYNVMLITDHEIRIKRVQVD